MEHMIRRYGLYNTTRRGTHNNRINEIEQVGNSIEIKFKLFDRGLMSFPPDFLHITVIVIVTLFASTNVEIFPLPIKCITLHFLLMLLSLISLLLLLCLLSFSPSVADDYTPDGRGFIAIPGRAGRDNSL